MLTLLVFAFLAGLATSLSPCVLVVLPIILSTSLQKSKAQPIATVIGLTFSFFVFTLFLGSLIRATGISATALRYASMFIVFAFGVALLIPSADRLISRLFNPLTRIGNTIDMKSRRIDSPALSGLVLGVALGLLWTPCAGPILASVTTLVATQNISINAVLLVALYAIGSSLPLLAFALLGQKMVTTSRFLKRHVESIRRIFGALMIATSLLMFAELDTQFVQATLKFVPVLSVDTNTTVSSELAKLRAPTNNTPELTGNSAWINSQPLSLNDLRGKVVLVDFWTYSCINCIRTLPHLKRWYDTYKDEGFVIIGVHTPEFEFEKDEANVRRAAQRFDIRYPIALDNDYATWNAFNNEAWPQRHLIDQEGVVVEKHIGEGDYQQTEERIRALLKKAPGAPRIDEPALVTTLTPETYLGHQRAEAYEPQTKIVKDKPTAYAGSTNPGQNQVSLRGEFLVGEESLTSMKDGSELLLNFNAAQVFLVLTGSSKIPLKVSLDNKPTSEIIIDEPRMYEIIDLKKPASQHLLKLTIPQGVSAFAFTFGGG